MSYQTYLSKHSKDPPDQLEYKFEFPEVKHRCEIINELNCNKDFSNFKDMKVLNKQNSVPFEFKVEMAEDDHQVIRKLEKIHQNLSRDHTILNHEISDPLEERKELISSDIENETRINNRMRDKTAAELGLRKRKDVVLKTLLRKIRSCIRNDFILYSKNFKRKSDMHIENIQRRLKNFISNCMEEEPTDSFCDTLGIFICTEQIEGTLYQLNSHQHKMELVKKIKEVRETLYKFNFSKLSNLLDYPGMTKIIRHYFKIQNQDLLSSDERIGLQILLEEIQI